MDLGNSRIPKWAAALIVVLVVTVCYQWYHASELKHELYAQKHATTVAVAAHAELQDLTNVLLHAQQHPEKRAAAPASAEAEADAGVEAELDADVAPAPVKTSSSSSSATRLRQRTGGNSNGNGNARPPAPPSKASSSSSSSSSSSAAPAKAARPTTCPKVTKVCELHPLEYPHWGVPHHAPPAVPTPTPRPYDPSTTGGAPLQPLPPPVCLRDPVCVPWLKEVPKGVATDGRPLELVRSRYNTQMWRNDGARYDWFWGDKNPEGFFRWEEPTFDTFHKFLTADTVHIDFGCWIGPTVLFAAQHAKQVFAMEPDPLARTAALANIDANPHLKTKIKLFAECISDKKSTLSMSGDGQSGSAISAVGQANFNAEKQRTGISFEVQCDTLPAFFRTHNLDRRGRYFVKMDTESAEALIVPSLYEWLRDWNDDDDGTGEYNGKPTLLISIHTAMSDAHGGHVSRDSRSGLFPWWSGDPTGAAFLKTLLLYRSVSDQSRSPRWLRDVNPITIADIQECLRPCPTCHWGCDLLATDIDY